MKRPPKNRDYIAEFEAMIADGARGDSFDLRQTAISLVARLRQADPRLLAGWLDELAEEFIYEYLRQRASAGRGKLTGSKDFGNRLREVAREGDTAPLRSWLDSFWTVASGRVLRLGSMQRDDLRLVERSFIARVRANQMRAVFFATLAEKVGDGTVEEHFSDEQLSAMWGSLSQ